jgi:ATP-dependent helicase/nuclease subunit A
LQARTRDSPMSQPDSNNPLLAAEPRRNATVHASAGTGKTWLLVTRILRLLLNGARPDSILAVTFTRKAAAEMQQRVTERLHELMCADDRELDKQLGMCGITADDATRTRARQLYEDNLFAAYSLRATTFHAFCQELLQRFPLEAGISPGFELVEATGQLEQQAWDSLINESSNRDHPVNSALDTLVEGCAGLPNTSTALRSFLSHRSDWWAYCQDQPHPVEHAGQQLQKLLAIEPDADPLGNFPNDIQRAQLKRFADLLTRNGLKKDLENAGQLYAALEDALNGEELYAAIQEPFLTKAGTARARKSTDAQRKRLGDEADATFIELHQTFCALLDDLSEQLARINTYHNTLAWLTTGTRLLAAYQRIKQEQRLLDFSDLEWKACELLNRDQHASWVQYKLDTRIDHLLVDEFQDTNPTQWRLLKPLLEELAAGNDDRARSVFLVGDKKQSIYSFRRANPALLGEASAWLRDNLQASNFPLDASRRSAQAVIDCINAVFDREPLRQRLDGFNTHSTHHPDLYGHVELLPLSTDAAETEAAPDEPGLRNPLHRPRSVREDLRYAREAGQLAAKIKSLIEQHTPVTKDGVTQALHYGDVIILLRQRTHISAYERALRDAQIPYLSDSKGALLDNLEIRDLECLLNVLISPYDNLALAQVLRSPVFGIDSEQLLPLVTAEGATWYERLASLSGEQPFADIYPQLQRWRALAGHIPVHDLLDRIFHEASIVQRYRAAFPPALQPRVSASLTRFIELALEVDNGRYPSLPRFLDQLNRLRRSDADQPGESTPIDADSRRVRIMTIHGAKGLEAPVVFLADSATTSNSRSAYNALVDWPGKADRPTHFLLTGKKGNLDRVSKDLLDRQARVAQREEANLLYVALTRARQYLYISGSEKEDADADSWYGMISAALTDWNVNADGNPCHTTGIQGVADRQTETTTAASTPDRRLSGALQLVSRQRLIAPSRVMPSTAINQGDADGRERGTAIHFMLEQLASGRVPCTGDIPAAIANELHRDTTDLQVQAWWQEAVRTVQDETHAAVFNAANFERAYNEVPIQYEVDGKLVYGIIDRLVVHAGTALVVDYKTQQQASAESLEQLTGHYREQLRLYADGVARLWPDLTVTPCLLFTACGTLVRLEYG